MLYANVIVDISHEAVDRPFTYIIPDRLIDRCHPGTRVMAPFGRGDRLKVGIIVDIKQHPDIPITRLKEIDSIVLSQDATDSRLIELAAFIKKRYGSTMIDALKTVLPAKKEYRSKKTADTLETECLEEPAVILNEEQQRVLDDFKADYDAGINDVRLIHGITGSGKTEVYIGMIRHVVNSGRQAVMLIPEIGLNV